MKLVILAGGGGTRFWPKSRFNRPKQCIPIISNKPMIVETVERLKDLANNQDINISTGSHLALHLKKILPNVNYVIEPMPKNTAAAIGLSAISIPDDDVLVFETADHYYLDVPLYIEHLKVAIEEANKGYIALIGIKPNCAHTGYGYIKEGNIITNDSIKTFQIDFFKEKPDHETAEKYLREGKYLWNSGMFIAKKSTLLKSFEKHMPHLYASLKKIEKSKFDQEILKSEFEKLENISIDYGIMEKANNKVVVRGEFPWEDVGDWATMEKLIPLDNNKNAVQGSFSGSAKNSIIIGNKIELNNIENLIIVDAPDSLLICAKDKSQFVKNVVDELNKDPELKKFAEDEQSPVEHHIQIESKNLDIKGTAIIATIGVSDLIIEKSNKVKISKK